MPPNTLPNDIEALKALLMSSRGETAVAKAEAASAKDEADRLKRQKRQNSIRVARRTIISIHAAEREL